MCCCPRSHRLPRLLLFALALSAVLAAGELKLLEVYTDHMVLQRDQPVAISGRAAGGASVVVAFAGQMKRTVADSSGDWSVTLDPLQASAHPQELQVSSLADRIRLTDVLVGDVWLCSGQSNMDRPLNNFSQLRPSLAAVHLPTLRLFAVEHVQAPEPQDHVVVDRRYQNSWQLCAEPYLSPFSPLGYLFGAQMIEELGIPIGIIKAGWGATRIEAWLPRPAAQEIGLVDVPEGRTKQDVLAELYHAIIHPLRRVTLKGILWYQGESNSKWPARYAVQFPALIRGWRAAFRQPDLPFYFVQLASYGSSWNAEGDAWAYLREAQTKALALPRTGMVVTLDVGEFSDIHPQAKQIVAARLARWALALEGKTVVTSGPTFRSMQVRDGRCIITFDAIAGGLRTRQVVMNRQKDQPLFKDPQAYVVPASRLVGFTVGGADRIFHPAEARIVGPTVELSAKEVPAPLAVRYGWANFALCNLYNSAGLPAAPFRTDDFPLPEPVNPRKP